MVKSWGAYTDLQPGHILVDEKFLEVHPKVFKSLQHRNRIVNERIPEMYEQIKDIVVPSKARVRRKPPPVPATKEKPTVKRRATRPLVGVVRRSTRLQKGV